MDRMIVEKTEKFLKEKFDASAVLNADPKRKA